MEGEPGKISISPEYDDAYQEALALPAKEISELKKRLEQKMADLLERLQQKEGALSGQLTEREQEIVLAEKQMLELARAQTVDAYEGLLAGFRARPEQVAERANRQFQKIELKVQDPIGDKSFSITYDCPDKKFCLLYNMAIKHILEAAHMKPFLQSGGWDEPGWHMWELWQFTNHEQVEGFLELIRKEAEALFEKYKNQDYFWEED